MTDMNKMNVEALENVAGGEWRQVNTRTVQNGVLRCGPGTSTTLMTAEHGMSLIPRITAGWQDAFWVFRNNAPESLNNSPKNAEAFPTSAFFNLIYLSRSRPYCVIYPPHQRFIDLSSSYSSGSPARSTYDI